MARPQTEKLFRQGIEHHRGGRLKQAEASYRRVLERDPQHVDALHLLGAFALSEGRLEAAVAFIQRALAQAPGNAHCHSNLGEAYRRLGRNSEALTSLGRAIELKADFVEALHNLGLTLRALGRPSEAVACHRRALDHRPDALVLQHGLAEALSAADEVEEAIEWCERCLASSPEAADLHVDLGNALRDSARADEALASYRRALELAPDHAGALGALGTLLKDLGRVDEAIVAMRGALALDPSNAALHSCLVYTSMFRPRSCARDVLEEAKEWARTHGVSASKPPVNDRDPARRLRIGYVSPDFRDHCQALFMVPVLTHHDREGHEIFCYSSVRRPDATTERLGKLAGVFRSVLGKSDAETAELIREDRIDILVDLTMHMAEGRLSLFARKSAPVQVSWLAYPGTTGLPAIDYRLSDPFLDPPDATTDMYSEKTVRLPDTFWCYDPLNDDLVPGPLPADRNGHVTFGCLNNFCKVNEPLLELWGRILASVPGSRLVLLALPGETRERVWAALEQRGIARTRVEFLGYRSRSDYLKSYDDIDVGLDPVPYNGHTTALDSFWMGVPVVTLVGSTVVGRAGLCQAMNLGLPELVATTPDEYVRIALELVRDLGRLGALRAELRTRMERSPLMDAPRFVRNLEAAYRNMWKEWCAEARGGETAG